MIILIRLILRMNRKTNSIKRLYFAAAGFWPLVGMSQFSESLQSISFVPTTKFKAQ